MKKILFCLLILHSTTTTFGVCYHKEIIVFPNSTSISPNSLISIEGHWMGQKIVNELTFLRPIYLKVGKLRVELELIENCVSQGGTTRVIFRPKNTLIAGAIYELVVENLTRKEQKFFTRGFEPDKHIPIYWTVKKNTDTTAPKWLKKPKLKDTFWEAYGCGNAAYALFDYELKDDSEVLIKTELLDLHTNKPIVYYLQREYKATQLKVGHGMCGGAFYFEKDRSYQVRFGLMDACGNTTGGWTDWVAFESPENKAVW